MAEAGGISEKSLTDGFEIRETRKGFICAIKTISGEESKTLKYTIQSSLFKVGKILMKQDLGISEEILSALKLRCSEEVKPLTAKVLAGEELVFKVELISSGKKIVHIFKGAVLSGLEEIFKWEWKIHYFQEEPVNN